jgi:membrane protein YdbS with pleckstrin-like domain
MFDRLISFIRPLLKLPEGPPAVPGPAGTPGRVFRAAEPYRTYRYVIAAFGVLGPVLTSVVGAGALWFSGRPWTPLLAVALLLCAAWICLLAYLTARLDYEFRYYVVTEHSLRIREGVWFIREITLSFVNVQNVAIEQGPIERLLGIANVHVQTAGGGARTKEGHATAHEGVLRGIDNAQEIRDLIRARLGQAHRSAGLGDRDDDEAQGFTPRHQSLLREIREETKALART